jgi:hypothetical protein
MRKVEGTGTLQILVRGFKTNEASGERRDHPVNSTWKKELVEHYTGN